MMPRSLILPSSAAQPCHVARTFVPRLAPRTLSGLTALAGPQPMLSSTAAGSGVTVTVSTCVGGAPGSSGPPCTVNVPPGHGGRTAPALDTIAMTIALAHPSHRAARRLRLITVPPL